MHTENVGDYNVTKDHTRTEVREMRRTFEEIAAEAKKGETCHWLLPATTEKFELTMLHMDKWISNICEYIRNKKGFRLVEEYEPEEDIVEVTIFDKDAKCDEGCKNQERRWTRWPGKMNLIKRLRNRTKK